MEISPIKILENINYKIRNRNIFKLNREFLVKSLIIASTQVQLLSLKNLANIDLVNQIIEQFKFILNFIFSANNENGEIPSNPENTILNFSEMILEFVYMYTPVRNYLDQCIIGTRNIKFNDVTEVFFEENYDPYSNYSRILDRIKEYPNEKIKLDVYNRLKKYLSDNKFKPKLFKDMYFNSLIDDYRQICWLDSEIKFNHDFKEFTYDDLISFCAALKLIGDYYSFFVIKQPCIVIDYETLVRGIIKLSKLSEDKVKLFIDYQTYDYKYQKSKLTLFQSLIRFENKFYFYPVILSIGLLPIKMYKIIIEQNKEKYNKDVSSIAKKKEKQMTKEIFEQFAKYNLNIILNRKFKRDNLDLAEYDMLAFDNKTSNLYIFEFKWYFIGDGESEHKKLDCKIKEDIKHRKEKNTFIYDNQKFVSDELFNGKKFNKIYEILISQNFSGISKHEMTVIDFESLQRGIKCYNNFEKLMNYFLLDEFRKSIKIDIKAKDFEIEGYKFNFYMMVKKNSM